MSHFAVCKAFLICFLLYLYNGPVRRVGESDTIISIFTEADNNSKGIRVKVTQNSNADFLPFSAIPFPPVLFSDKSLVKSIHLTGN